jgi:hypothetical protein
LLPVRGSCSEQVPRGGSPGRPVVSMRVGVKRWTAREAPRGMRHWRAGAADSSRPTRRCP